MRPVQHHTVVHKRPVQRYDHEEHEPHNHKSNYKRHFTRPRQVITDSNPDNFHDRNFNQYHEEKDTEMHDYFHDNARKSIMEDNKNQMEDAQVESRENIFDDDTNLKSIFDEDSFNFDFDAESFPGFMDVQKQNVQSEDGNKFNAPVLVEKFNSPLQESEAYPFLDTYEKPKFEMPKYEKPQYEKPKFEMPKYEKPQYEKPQYGKPQYKEPNYEEQPKVKPFQDFGEIYQKVVKEPVKKEMIQEKPNFTNFETIEEMPKMELPKPEALKSYQNVQTPPEKLPTFTNFPKKFESFTKKPTTSKKPVSPKASKYVKLPTFTNFKTIQQKPESQPAPSPSFSSLPKEPNTNFPSFTNFKAQSSKPQYKRETSFNSLPSKPSNSNPTFPSFINLEGGSNTPSFENFKTLSEKKSKPIMMKEKPTKPTPQPTFQSFEKEEEKSQFVPTKPPTPTKKPYNYEKKNFREPLQQVNKNAGPHQIIRIKTPSREMKPQPKQLRLKDPVNQSGFRPISDPVQSQQRYQPQPSPGTLLIEEVNRRNDEVVYDNQQPLITLDSVKSNTGGHFRGQSQPNNYAFNVKASFLPKQESNSQQPRIQRRLIRVPSSRFSSRSNKAAPGYSLRRSPMQSRSSSSSLAPVLTQKFESSRIG